jgi:3-carboxy-cis,cis-muconate cycloisomerase
MPLLKSGMARDGVPIPSLVHQLKAVTDECAVHVGATSQDVMDTSLVMVLRDTSDLIATRLSLLIEALHNVEKQFGDQALMGRTRMQAATLITVRDRLLSWRLPLESHEDRLVECRTRVERVQIGGASGDRAALGDHAGVIVSHVAKSLNLTSTDKAWHAMRESIVDYASFLSLVTGSLGKLGQDVALMAQQGIDDITVSGCGGSSAMAHKQNPVLAELLITLARFNAVQVSGMHQSLVHEQERSGAAWSLEWMLLPQMAQATGRALSAALELVNNIQSLGHERPGSDKE